VSDVIGKVQVASFPVISDLAVLYEKRLPGTLPSFKIIRRHFLKKYRPVQLDHMMLAISYRNRYRDRYRDRYRNRYRDRILCFRKTLTLA